jgi:diaminopimelate epimerase
MKAVPFVKGHGLSNDFVVIRESDLDAPMTSQIAKRICDRRRGVGADGVLIHRTLAQGQAFMQILNSDGTEPEMCGNGLRVFARYLVEERGFDAQSLTIETLAGTRRASLHGDRLVQVEMDQAQLLSEPDGLEVELPGLTVLVGTYVSMGNPHFVVFEDQAPKAPAVLSELGQAAQRHAAFKGGVNLSSAAISGPQRIDLRVFERGCGLTQACGTAACAVAAAALKTGRSGPGVPVDVFLPGGALNITVNPEDLRVEMKGPAEMVARGFIDPSLFD